jgi:hypothetical protein
MRTFPGETRERPARGYRDVDVLLSPVSSSGGASGFLGLAAAITAGFAGRRAASVASDHGKRGPAIRYPISLSRELGLIGPLRYAISRSTHVIFREPTLTFVCKYRRLPYHRVTVANPVWCQGKSKAEVDV